MLSKYVNQICASATIALKYMEGRYKRSEESLKDHISMRPKDIIDRSVKTANWSTIIAIVIIYPILYYYRGFDLQLFSGMILHYASMWLLILALVVGIQFIWLINYCISQRFVENMLDFEIIERVFGGQDDHLSDYEDEIPDNSMKRASG